MKGINILEKYGIRDTQPRRELVKSIFSFGQRHFSADDLLRAFRKKKVGVSRATIFRTVNLLTKKGLLRSIDLGRGFQMYELAVNSDHHDHLYCVKCGEIIEFEDKTFEKLQDKVCNNNNFIPLKYTLRILGLCKECKRD